MKKEFKVEGKTVSIYKDYSYESDHREAPFQIVLETLEFDELGEIGCNQKVGFKTEESRDKAFEGVGAINAVNFYNHMKALIS